MAQGRMNKTALFAAGIACGLVAAFVVANPFVGGEAAAGGVCKGNLGAYVTSDDSGKQLYVWHLTTNPPQVYAYSFDRGTYVHKDLSLPATPKADEEKKPPKKHKDINVSGTIWTPEPSERVAIINGKTYREGDVFTTKSGKKYKVVEIKPTNEVVYEEVKE